MSATAALLPGDRLHLQDGPIDLVIGVDGARHAGFAAAQARFDGLLAALMDDYSLLCCWDGPRPAGSVARRMWQAVQVHPRQATPMAAVAGAVAEAVLAAIVAVPGIRRAYVNNGGDIAFHLTPGETFRIAMAPGSGRIVVGHGDPVRGVATSGRGGRSLSMGIADSVTVLARDAAAADVAATLIANAVDLPGNPAIRRAPANSLREGSDLGDRPVVAACAALSAAEIAAALDRGRAMACDMRDRGAIVAAALRLGPAWRFAGKSAFPNLKEFAHA